MGQLSKKYKNAPKVMTDILKMRGLKEVKKTLCDIYSRIKVQEQQKDSSMASSMNASFVGNPGTGKTTIARHYGTFLKELGILGENASFVETTAAKLINKGVNEVEEKLKDIGKVGGGIVFIDESYQLVTDPAGKRVLDFILPIATTLQTEEYGKVVWVFAGYKKDMEKLFEHNEGLRSRFPHNFHFDDFTDDELEDIFISLIETQSKEEKEAVTTTDGNRGPSLPRRSRGNPALNGMNYYGFNTIDGTKKKDKFQHEWTFNGGSWNDEYGSCTLDPNQVGTDASPVEDIEGNSWIHSNNAWKSNGKPPQKHYPGDKAPPASTINVQRECRFKYNSTHIRIAAERLGRRRGIIGFGNARAVNNMWEQIRNRQASRVANCQTQNKPVDVMALTQSDILGAPVTEKSLKASEAYKELQSMEGLKPVKDGIDALIKVVVQNHRRELERKTFQQVMLNKVFVGNPGTGKTTVAAIYGRLLAEMGLLSKGEVRIKTVSDFVGDAVGASEKVTREILKASQGCVLVIDEAYSFYTGKNGSSNNDPYKTSVVDTLVEQIQARPGDDMAVLLLGYEEEMKNMFRNVNPGLSRRFQADNPFIFPDYSDDSLYKILQLKAKKRGFVIPTIVCKAAVRTLAKARAKPHFGNAGAVENMLSEAVRRNASSFSSDSELSFEDFGINKDDYENNERMLDNLFRDMVGMDSIKTQLERLRKMIQFANERGDDPRDHVGFNYLFVGSPGTGKTTVARKMGKMFHSLGILPSEEVLELSASDLSTGYVGQAGKLTREKFQEARGGVLFIDEAYQLNPAEGGAYAKEALDEIVKCITSDEFKDKLVVIFAGYKHDMDELLQVNKGLVSRFTERIQFEDLSADAVAELMKLKTEKYEAVFDIEDVMQELAEKLVKAPDFGNGRDVDTWAVKLYNEMAMEGIEEVNREVLTKSLDSILNARKTQPNEKEKPSRSKSPKKPKPQLQTATVTEPTTTTKVSTAVKCSHSEAESELQPPTSEDTPENTFDEIDKQVLASLQDVCDELGLNTKDGMQKIANIDKEPEVLKQFQQKLMDRLNISEETALNHLMDWNKSYKKMYEELKKQEKLQKTLKRRPIWRCGVCGRADKPYIVCYVAPFIVRYENIVNLN
eukprot:m.71998 g.71998  ORF g.71998 m.71998 type:complete len:1128 (-) comp12295_c1_seq1:71-3454(-)